MPQWVRDKISQSHKKKGIKPPSNKGKKFTKQHVQKIIASKKANGSIYHTQETIEKIQKSRKKHYDKVGRISNLTNRIKRTKKYKSWREAVYKKDDYTCVFCGVRGGQLEADHIIQKAKYFKDCDNDYNKCMDYPPLWNVDNGRTLCKDCHKITPSYGKVVR